MWEEALCRSFPTLFNMAIDKDALVRDAWTVLGKEEVGALALIDPSMIGS